MAFAENIKRLRTFKDLTQSELAAIAGVTNKAVSAWENEGKVPRMGIVEILAKYFNIKKSELLGLDEEKTQNIASTKADPDSDISQARINRLRNAGYTESQIEQIIDYAVLAMEVKK